MEMKGAEMRVYVAGGSGAIGRRLIPQLIAAGHDVVATTSSRRGIEELEILGAHPLVVDGLDEEAVVKSVCLAEPDVIVNEMTALAGATNLRNFDRAFARTNELRTKGNNHLIRAAQIAQVRRVISQSYTGWSNARDGDGVKTERDRLDPDPPKTMRRSLDAIRHLERSTTRATRLEGIVLRYGSLYGPGTAFSTDYVDLVRKRRLPLIGDGSGVWSFVHVDDAAAATVLAVERASRGVYNVVDDDPAPVSDWLPFLADVLGARQPRRIPAWLARIVAGEAITSMSTRITGSSNAKARRELRWEPRYRSWREGFREALTEAPASYRTLSLRRVESAEGVG
jgi:2-alkyl-3-oxoalkanoate reductase